MRARITVCVALLSLGLSSSLARATPAAAPPTAPESLPNIDAPAPKPLAPPLPPRGQMLYENHCTACHESVVHIRQTRRTPSLAALRGRVTQWADYLRLDWGVDEVEEVTRYLDDRYYRFESR